MPDHPPPRTRSPRKAVARVKPVPDANEAAPQSSPPGISIALDPAIPGDALANRLDLTIRGRVLSLTPLAHVRLQVGDWVTSASAYGQSNPAPACNMPDGTPARQRMFRFNLPRPATNRPDRCQFRIIARTADGLEHAEDFVLTVDPAAASPRLLSGPTDPAASSFPAYALLFMEHGIIDTDATLTVQGWGISFGPIQALRVLVDDTFVTEAVHRFERQDVASAFPAYPNALLSGFGLTFPLDAALRDAKTVRVRMICLNGFSHEESIPLQRGKAEMVFPTPAPFALMDRPLSYQLTLADQSANTPQRRSVPPPEWAAAPHSAQAETASIDLFCDAANLTGDGVLTLEG